LYTREDEFRFRAAIPGEAGDSQEENLKDEHSYNS